MGKKSREKKSAKLEMLNVVKQAADVRRKERMAPIWQLTRKFVLTLFFTALLLVLGMFVNRHLSGIIARIRA